MDKKQLSRIALTAVLLFVAWMVTKSIVMPVWGQLLVYLVPYIIISYDVVGEAIEEGIGERNPFNEDFLMCVATIGALLIGFLPGAEPQFPEAVFVMLFFQVGELFEDYAEDRSKRSINDLMDIRPTWPTWSEVARSRPLTPRRLPWARPWWCAPARRCPWTAR